MQSMIANFGVVCQSGMASVPEAEVRSHPHYLLSYWCLYVIFHLLARHFGDHYIHNSTDGNFGQANVRGHLFSFELYLWA